MKHRQRNFWTLLTRILACVSVLYSFSLKASQALPPRLVLTGTPSGPVFDLTKDPKEEFVIASFMNGNASMFDLRQRDFKPINYNLPIQGNDQILQRERPIAISNDRSIVAIGEPKDSSIESGLPRIYLLNRESGRILTKPIVVPTRPQAISFWLNKDTGDEYLLAVLSKGEGLRVWRTNNWELVSPPTDRFEECINENAHNLELCNGRGIALNPNKDHRVKVVVSGMYGITFYNHKWERIDYAYDTKKMRRIKSVAFSPEGEILAIGSPILYEKKHRDFKICSERNNNIYLLSMKGNGELIEPLVPPLPHPEDKKDCSLSSVSWSNSGRYLYAGARYFVRDPTYSICSNKSNSCSYSNLRVVREYGNVVVRWDMRNKKQAPSTFNVGTATVMDILPYGEGFIFGTQAGLIGGYNETGVPMKYRQGANGNRVFWNVTPAFDLRNHKYGSRRDHAFRLSRDGLKLTFQPLHDHFEYTFDLRRNDFVDSKVMSNYHQFTPRLPSGFEFVPDKCNQVFWGGPNGVLRKCPSLDISKRSEMSEKEISGCDQFDKDRVWGNQLDSAIVGDTSNPSIALVTSKAVLLLDCDLDTIASTEVPVEAKRVAGSADGRFFAVAFGDGRISWYDHVAFSNNSKSKPIVSLLSDYMAKRFIIWSEDGIYESSEGGEDFLGYVTNIPESDPPQVSVVGIGQLRSELRRERYLRNILMNWTPGVIKTGARLSSKITSTIVQKALSTPYIENVQVIDNRITTEGDIFLTFTVSGPIENEIEILEVDVTVDGLLVKQSSRNISSHKDRPTTIKIKIESKDIPDTGVLPEQQLAISLTVRNAKRKDALTENTRRAESQISNRNSNIMDHLPTVWGVFVGVSNYTEGVDPLSYAHKDAKDFETFWKNHQNNYVFSKKSIVLLAKPNESVVTAMQITDAVNEIKKLSQRGEIKTNDLIVFYFSGHGIVSNTDGRLLLLPSNTDPNNFAKKSVTLDDLAPLNGIEGVRKWIVIDACRNEDYSKEYTNYVVANIRDKMEHSEFFMSTNPGYWSFELPASNFHNNTKCTEFDFGDGSSVFTRIFIEGLLGQADVGSDGVVAEDDMTTFFTLYKVNSKFSSEVMKQSPKRILGRALDYNYLKLFGREHWSNELIQLPDNSCSWPFNSFR
ncbi:MAG: caspase family protein [Candidatus Thiodiazotropha endolucinida]